MKTIIIICCTLTLFSCAQPPKPLQGDFIDMTPKNYIQNPIADLKIRWTGFVVDVENQKDYSCLIIIGKLADAYAKPSRQYRMDTGRFIACKPQFLDPASIKNKPVTVIGHVKKVVTKNINNHPYSHPLIDAETIYVW